jgi:hypothetical protein
VTALTDAGSLRLAQSQGYVPMEPPRTLKSRRIDGVDDPMDLAVVAE